jgi:hypothetical protein
MEIRDYTRWATRIALVLGMLAFFSCFNIPFLFYGMVCSVLGTILSIIVIFIRTRFAVPTNWTHPSIIALVLCSTPVLYVLLLIFIRHE